ncbi:Aldehyde dehydrogenase [Cyphellophora attinorum]|uniref:aldehyde dehydrogenase (NAD(+)) n=1 Tax=Cyphellophora attinorum TaxID=1664694 RepID=A0A0N1H4V3_9EURO|nr:Aldehyde dehydrogenase [Phialophora attinorum]KPI36520.1 Aldehyde dehydrogenase [Phialophora attinorum]
MDTEDTAPCISLVGANGLEMEVPTGLFIDNQFIPSVTGSLLEVINPNTNQPLGQIASASSADIDAAVQSSLQAYKATWRDTAPATRRDLLNRLADLMVRDTDILASIESLDVGALYTAGKYFTVPLAVEWLRYFAGWADKLDGRSTAVVEGGKVAGMAYTRREPLGVTAAITPWNSPLLISTWKVAQALTTGNTLILKPAELAPLGPMYLGKLAREAGFPNGVLNVVPGIGNIAGKALAQHAHVRKISFTGSTAVGRQILHDAASSNLKKVALELGGKSPTIVFDDADVNQTAIWAARGITAVEGQVCLAGSRIYVQDKVYDAFCEAFVKETSQAVLGDPLLEKTTKGPIISSTQLAKVAAYIEQGRKEATLLRGGNCVENSVTTTAFSDVPETATIMTEEIFGPVAAIARFHTVQEVVDKANDTEYGLSAAIFTTSLARAHQVASALESGQVTVNAWGLLSANMPFGGYKQSGFGRDGGEEALAEWTTIKAVKIFTGEDQGH